jgi:hypothetical protein
MVSTMNGQPAGLWSARRGDLIAFTEQHPAIEQHHGAIG